MYYKNHTLTHIKMNKGNTISNKNYFKGTEHVITLG